MGILIVTYEGNLHKGLNYGTDLLDSILNINIGAFINEQRGVLSFQTFGPLISNFRPYNRVLLGFCLKSGDAIHC